MFNGGTLNTVAIRADTSDDSKYSTSKNPLTGLYYRLHILNVGVSDVKKYRCYAIVDGVNKRFYLKLDLVGRCYYCKLFICNS